MTNAKRILILALIMCATSTIGLHATSRLDSLRIGIRIGYEVGGTLPTHLDNKIRHINNFDPGFNYSLGAEVSLPVGGRWFIHSGLRYELGSMDVDSRVKNYDIEVVRGDESLDGIFNGNVRIMSAQRRFTFPLQAGFALSDKVSLRGGLFIGVLTHKRFWGWAYDGYLREGSPVGPKIEMGREPGERGDFDFGEDMRYCQWGIDAGADWQFHKRWGLFAELTYGLNGLFHSGFHSVQPLHPMYGILGFSYRIK